jgi:hypothetical protein
VQDSVRLGKVVSVSVADKVAIVKGEAEGGFDAYLGLYVK